MAFRRILLKVSGESLGDPHGRTLDVVRADAIAEQVAVLSQKGIEVGMVIGAGNLWRGAGKANLDRTTSDHIGMLATVMNALALQSILENRGVVTRVQSAISMDRIAEPYIRRRAMRHLEKGRVVIFAAGTGNPFFTTDSAAALRANEINADVLLKATKVDGVYDKDPEKHPEAIRYPFITYQEVMEKELKVMDLAAITLCWENNLPIIVFNMDEPQAIERVVDGEPVGSYVGRALPPERESLDPIRRSPQ